MRNQLLIALAFCAAPARADSDPLTQAVDLQVAAGAPKLHRLGDYYRAVANRNGDRSDWYVPLDAGKCYWLGGAGDPGVRELFLYVWGPDNKRIADNRPKSPQVTLAFCASMSGMHHVQAKVARGNGLYVVGVYSNAPGGHAVAAAHAAPTIKVTSAPAKVAAAKPAPVAPAPVKVAAAPPPPRPAPPPPRAPSHTGEKVWGALSSISASASSTSTTTTTDNGSTNENSESRGFGLGGGGFSATSTRTERHTTSTSTSNDDSPAEEQCGGQWTLGSTAMVNSRNPMGTECNDYYAPTNCPTGFYIQFPKKGKCYCMVRCSELVSAPAPTQNCTPDGSWVCNDYHSTISKNHATFCAPAEWNLCH
jgi:hypothetical protein